MFQRKDCVLRVRSSVGILPNIALWLLWENKIEIFGLDSKKTNIPPLHKHVEIKANTVWCKQMTKCWRSSLSTDLFKGLKPSELERLHNEKRREENKHSVIGKL